MICVIMLEPVTPGNVGAVARVMKNFSFENLVLVNPQCDHLCDESRRRAKHSQDVLENADVVDFFVVDDYDYLVATTARVGTDYNISRSPLKPADLADKLRKIDRSKKIGIVIGREGHGMFNEEIERCDFVVTIPSTPKYSTLNISHAVAVILYELHKAFADEHVASHIAPIGKPERDQIMKMFGEVFDGWPWETPEKRDTQERTWKKLLGKSMLTKREAFVVMGFLRKMLDEREGKFGVAGKAKKSSKGVAATSSKGTIKNKTPAVGKIVRASAAKAAGVKKAAGRVMSAAKSASARKAVKAKPTAKKAARKTPARKPASRRTAPSAKKK